MQWNARNVYTLFATPGVRQPQSRERARPIREADEPKIEQCSSNTESIDLLLEIRPKSVQAMMLCIVCSSSNRQSNSSLLGLYAPFTTRRAQTQHRPLHICDRVQASLEWHIIRYVLNRQRTHTYNGVRTTWTCIASFASPKGTGTSAYMSRYCIWCLPDEDNGDHL